jgi:hypothetical protein
LFILLAVASDAVILNRLRNLWSRSELKLVSSTSTNLPQQGEASHVP